MVQRVAPLGPLIGAAQRRAEVDQHPGLLESAGRGRERAGPLARKLSPVRPADREPEPTQRLAERTRRSSPRGRVRTAVDELTRLGRSARRLKGSG
jgi:hypothetical protein